MIVKTVLLGIGNIGAIYDIQKKIGITHASVIKKHKKFKLVAAIDNNKTRRILFEKKYKIKSYKNIKDFDDVKLANLLIITFKIKFSYLKKIIVNNNFKIIIFEKPFNYNPKELSLIKRLLKKNKIKFYINFQRNFSPIYKNMLNNIKNKSIGVNLKIVCFYSKSFLTNGIHFLSLFLNLSQKITLFKKISNDHLFIKLGNIEIIFFKTNTYNYNYNAFEIFGSKGKISLTSRPEVLTYYKCAQDKYFPNYKILKKYRYKNSAIDIQKYLYNEIYLQFNKSGSFLSNQTFNNKYINFLKKYKNEKNIKI
tara:strand:- start:6626 stop:7552 length:927 start_codon:yes stop_codon:yes gene_type:complete